jgi:hypothetical protein
MCLGFDHRATDGAQAGRSWPRSSAGWRPSTRRPPSGKGRADVTSARRRDRRRRVHRAGRGKAPGRPGRRRRRTRPRPGQAKFLTGKNVTLVASDLHSVPAMTAQMKGADAVIHGAGSYLVGSRSPSNRRCGTPTWHDERVLDAAIAAGVRRIVYVSTVNVFGDTTAPQPDESSPPRSGGGWLSYYDEPSTGLTKQPRSGSPPARRSCRHAVAGLRPNDHTLLSLQLPRLTRQAALRDTGRCRECLGACGRSVGGHTRGPGSRPPGRGLRARRECYRLRDAIAVAARVGGHRPPRMSLPRHYSVSSRPSTIASAVCPAFRRISAKRSAPATA